MTRRRLLRHIAEGKVYRSHGGLVCVEHGGCDLRVGAEFWRIEADGLAELLPSGRYGLTDAGRAELLAGAQ